MYEVFLLASRLTRRRDDYARMRPRWSQLRNDKDDKGSSETTAR